MISDPTQKKIKVFICYATVDLEFARKVYEWLKPFGWIDLWFAVEDLLPGQAWQNEIEKSIKDADITLILLSEDAFSQKGDLYHLREIRQVLSKAAGFPDSHVTFIPLLVDGVNPKDYLPENICNLVQRHWVDLSFEKAEIEIQTVLKKIAREKGVQISRKMKVFICYATPDLNFAQKVYGWLQQFDWIAPWFAIEDLLPGQAWEEEIKKSIETADITLILLSEQAFKREGKLYNLREIRDVLEKALLRPDHEVSAIPILLDGVIPKDYLPGNIGNYLATRQWIDISQGTWADNFRKLRPILELRAIEKCEIEINTLLEKDLSSGNSARFNQAIERVHEEADHINGSQHRFLRNALLNIISNSETVMTTRFMAAHQLDIELAEDSNYGRELKDILELNIYKAVPVPRSSVYMFQYPVTNIQYERFLTDDSFANLKHWMNLLISVDAPYLEGKEWIPESKVFQILEPHRWHDPKFGKLRRGFPVVGITFYEAAAYCNWLMVNWDDLPEKEANPGLRPRKIRLPTEDEWLKAAGVLPGHEKSDFPWRSDASETDVAWHHANVKESLIGQTTPVWMFPSGASPNGIFDMAGNVMEWTTTLNPHANDQFILHGGCWSYPLQDARLSRKFPYNPDKANYTIGFRAVVEYK